MWIDKLKASSAAEQRVKRMKANVKSARNWAKQLKVQTDTSAERLEMQKSRQRLAQLQTSVASNPIKPCS